ncbi:MAG: hypothetical protein R3343_05705 [Nitriliruptorales bacterium]|nr:hypothetical protein [Nitriliruptorales bacterium]
MTHPGGGTRTFTTDAPIDLKQTLGPLWHGRHDPTIRLRRDRLQWATRTPQGPGTVAVQLAGRVATAAAWGPGGSWLLEQAPQLVGATDDPDGFSPQHRAVERAWRRAPGLRIGACGVVWDVLVPTILAQKVTGLEAARSWLRLIRRFGEPAPGPLGLTLAPHPDRLAGLPVWDFHRAGVEEKRARTIRTAGARYDRLQEIAGMDTVAAYKRLTAMPGIGAWTAARVLRYVNGDTDAVEVGDFHIKHLVCWNLAGEPRGDDIRMMELLEPYRGHRGRVVRLLGVGAPHAPAYGPRQATRDIRAL